MAPLVRTGGSRHTGLAALPHRNIQPASTGSTYRAPESQEVVRVDFHDTDPIPYEQPLNIIPAATERNNLSVAEPMKLSVGSFHLTIPNGTDPQLLAQTLRIVKELEC